MPADSCLVLVLNSNDDVVALLREHFEDEGLRVASAHIVDLKAGRIDPARLLETQRPDVVLYDVAPPYDENWRYLDVLRPMLGGRPLVLTTVNKRALDEQAGPNDALEVMGKHSDLSDIVGAVIDACRPRRHPGGGPATYR